MSPLRLKKCVRDESLASVAIASNLHFVLSHCWKSADSMPCCKNTCSFGAVHTVAAEIMKWKTLLLSNFQNKFIIMHNTSGNFHTSKIICVFILILSWSSLGHIWQTCRNIILIDLYLRGMKNWSYTWKSTWLIIHIKKNLTSGRVLSEIE